MSHNTATSMLFSPICTRPAHRQTDVVMLLRGTDPRELWLVSGGSEWVEHPILQRFFCLKKILLTRNTGRGEEFLIQINLVKTIVFSVLP